MFKFMSVLLMTVLAVSAAQAGGIVKTNVIAAKSSKSAFAVKGKSHCVKGKIGQMEFGPQNSSDQSHNFGSKVFVNGLLDSKEVIATIRFIGPDHPGGFSLAQSRGRNIIVCDDGSFIF